MRLFSSKGRHLIGVDICATSVKLVNIQRQQGVFHLKSYGIEWLQPGTVVDKLIVDTEAVGEAITHLARRCQVAGTDAATAISSSTVRRAPPRHAHGDLSALIRFRYGIY